MDNAGYLYALVIFALIGVLVFYVVYRFFSDAYAPRSEETHERYPLTSNPGDPAVPDFKDKYGVAVYLLLLFGGFTLIANFAFLIYTGKMLMWLLNLGGAMFFLGAIGAGFRALVKGN